MNLGELKGAKGGFAARPSVVTPTYFSRKFIGTPLGHH
jgi:hypothetical protein